MGKFKCVITWHQQVTKVTEKWKSSSTVCACFCMHFYRRQLQVWQLWKSFSTPALLLYKNEGKSNKQHNMTPLITDNISIFCPCDVLVWIASHKYMVLIKCTYTADLLKVSFVRERLSISLESGWVRWPQSSTEAEPRGRATRFPSHGDGQTGLQLTHDQCVVTLVKCGSVFPITPLRLAPDWAPTAQS